jgi:hypothetical protein
MTCCNYFYTKKYFLIEFIRFSASLYRAHHYQKTQRRLRKNPADTDRTRGGLQVDFIIS